MPHTAKAHTERIVKAMLNPGFYPHQVQAPVVHIQTHISHVFLTGPFAYKLKKPVEMGFLDFTTLEARRKYCFEELRLNRRLAPEIYLGVWAVAEHDGLLQLTNPRKPQGQVLDYVVHMRQMDTSRMMRELISRGEVHRGHIRALARLLARFYSEARNDEHVALFGTPERVEFNVRENFEQTEAYIGITVSAERWKTIRDWSLRFIKENQQLLWKRIKEGWIREGHGDLHTGNINLAPDGKVHIFDCIEFNERFRHQDVACDLAFLAMDLDFLGQQELSRELVVSYIQASGDKTMVQLMDFYKCYRAMVRAKIHSFALDDPGLDETAKTTNRNLAIAYFSLAERYTGLARKPVMVCMMGLMGAGKSTLARMLAGRRQWMLVASDVVRKNIAGIHPHSPRHEPWGQGLYGPEMTKATYEALAEIAADRLKLGEDVIIDASFTSQHWRQHFLEVARSSGAKAVFVEVRCQPQELYRRLEARPQVGPEPSDGRLELLKSQQQAWEEPSAEVAKATVVIDNSGDPHSALEQLLKLLRQERPA